MRIFLTGAAGFIASHVAERLLARGDEIVGIDNFDETLYPKQVKHGAVKLLSQSPKFKFIEGDFTDDNLVDRVVTPDFDLVIHLGALAGVRPSLEQPKRYENVNVRGTLNLLEACRQAQISRFVFASSSSVYGADTPVPFREDAVADRPASPYAATKRAGELLLSNYAYLYKIGTTALRFFTVYGPRGRPEMAISSFLRKIAAGEPIPFFGDGSTSRDYTFIDDIAAGVIASVDTCTPESGHRVYNLGNSSPISLADLVDKIGKQVGKKPELKRLPLQPGDVPRTYADVSLAHKELGYKPQVSLDEGLARTWAWMNGQKS